MHIVIRLSPAPLTLFDDVDGRGARVAGNALVGGCRESFYVRSIAERSRSVGAQLRPGAARALLGADATDFAEQHTSLHDVWRRIEDARDELSELGPPALKLEAFERILLSRLSTARAALDLDQVVLAAVPSLDATPTTRIADLVRASGFSHRTFIARFRRAVGLSPKSYLRIRRFQTALARFASSDATDATLAGIAAFAGYSDQAHFSREFLEFSGISPGDFRALRVGASNHVPIR